MDKDSTRRKLPDEALLAMVDSLEDQITLVDEAGNIVFVNDSWLCFADDNGGERAAVGIGRNYFDACARAAKGGDRLAAQVAPHVLGQVPRRPVTTLGLLLERLRGDGLEVARERR